MTVKDLNPGLRKINPTIEKNLTELARRLTLLEELMDRVFFVSSGLRSEMDQLRINPKNPNSAHRTGEAADIADTAGDIYDFLINNPDMMIKLDLYVEQRTFTPTWTHIQIRPTKNRFFKP